MVLYSIVKLESEVDVGVGVGVGVVVGVGVGVGVVGATPPPDSRPGRLGNPVDSGVETGVSIMENPPNTMKQPL